MTTLLGAALIAAAGAAVMYLFDPDRGRSRRAKLGDQASSMARKTGEQIQAQARYQKGVAQGVAHKVKEPFQPEPEFDDETLLQKVRSEALGRWKGAKGDVVIDVNDGIVTLRGSAPADSVDELVDLVGAVPGVSSVDDQLSSGATSR